MAYFRRFYGTAKLSTDQHITPWRTAAISPLACSHREINYLRIQQRFFIGILKNVKIIRDETSIKYLKNRLFNRSALPIFPVIFFLHPTSNCNRSFFAQCIAQALRCIWYFSIPKKKEMFYAWRFGKQEKNSASAKIRRLNCWKSEKIAFSISKFLFIGTISNRFAILIVNHAEWKWKFHFAINAFRPSNHETLFSCHIMNEHTWPKSGRTGEWLI